MYLLLIIAFTHKNGQWQQTPRSQFFSFVTALFQLNIFFIHGHKVAVSQCENATGGKYSLPGFFIQEILGPVSDMLFTVRAFAW